MQLFMSSHARAAGVQLVMGHTLLKEKQPEDPMWAETVLNFQRLRPADLAIYPSQPYVDGCDV